MPTDRCYNHRENGVVYHIPGCWGCVIYGHERCTCRAPKHEDVADKIARLERRIEELEKQQKAATLGE